jgi:translation elongation factor EF-Tu-like GTPase
MISKKATGLSNEERISELVIDRKEGTVTLELPIEDRLSGSEKSIVVAGIVGQMTVMVGKEKHTLAVSLYKKNPEYDAEAAAKRRAEAKSGTVKTGFVAQLVG